jgi:ATP-binding cassette subfamily B protein
MKSLKLLLPYLQRYKLRILLGFLCVTISNVCSTYIPRVVGQAIDTIQTGNFSDQDLYRAIISLIALSVGSGLFSFFTRQTIIVSSRLIEYDLHRDFLETIERRSMNFFQQNSTGSLMAYSTNDIAAAREFLGPAIMYGANTITTFSFALYYMTDLSTTLTIAVLFPLPILALATHFLGKKIHVAFKNVQQQFSALNTLAQESFSGIRIVRAYLSSSVEQKRFADESRSYSDKNLKLSKIYAVAFPMFMTLVGLSQLVVLGYGGWMVMNDIVTIGTLTQFFIYLNMLIWPVAAIGWITNIIQRAAASCARLSEVLSDNRHDEQTGSGNITELDMSKGIVFRNVGLRYPESEHNVLEGIDLTIPADSSLGIVGTIGSGKSSLLSLIPALNLPTEGEITFGGEDIRNIPLRLLRRGIGFVSQDPFLFSLSIEDNIKLGCPESAKGAVEEAARIAGVHDEILSFPDKYSTILGERGITLSGGQKQRTALARAIAKDPAVLVLDDSLSAVDAQTEAQVLSKLKDFMKERITVIVSHRISTVSGCDNIIVLGEGGTIVERGSHEELIARSGLYSEMAFRQRLEEELESL